MAYNIDFLIFKEDELMPHSLKLKASALFKKNYYNYHYLEDIGVFSRTRIVALYHEEIVGYASFKVIDAYAHAANLLIDQPFRGNGIGQQLESLRFSLIVARKKFIYVSCMCDDLGSQTLKLKLGLTPVCLKYGYRYAVKAPDTYDSAILFTNGEYSIGRPIITRIWRDEKQNRLRIIISSQADLVLLAQRYNNYYVEVLSGLEFVESLIQNKDYIFSGIDLDQSEAKWYYCFQLKNERYYNALVRPPQLSIEPTYFNKFLVMNDYSGKLGS